MGGNVYAGLVKVLAAEYADFRRLKTMRKTRMQEKRSAGHLTPVESPDSSNYVVVICKH
jgi:hypothetical protein